VTRYDTRAIHPGVALAMADKKFVPPDSLEEGERLKIELVDALNEINDQLGRRKGARDEAGNYVESEQSFWQWRKSAITAKRHKEAALRRLNLWLKNQRRSVFTDRLASAVSVDASDPVALLRAAYELLHRLACEGVDLDPGEQATKDVVRSFLEANT
jgi:hypothetical protein